MGKRLLAALAATLMIACGYLAVGLQPAGADDQSDAMTFLTLLNQVRGSKGLRALNVDPRLVSIAQGWSNKMAADHGISHNPNLATQAPAGWQVVGENVGMGGSVQTLHDAFVASPHHYENMIEPRYNAVGIAVTRGDNNTIYVTVD